MLWQYRLAVVLGTNEIASAVAVALYREGRAVVLSHDPNPPVIRRGMAFHDVLYGTPRTLEAIAGQRVDSIADMFAAFAVPDTVAVTPLALSDLIAASAIDVLVDGRMQKYTVKPDLRHLAAITIGLGPGFRVSANCDFAVETQPAKCGRLIDDGTTDAPDGVPALLGAAGRERFAYAADGGCWHTARDIGEHVAKGSLIGYLDSRPIAAPIDGVLRGVVRDGLAVPMGAKLLEIDPRGRCARWCGIDDRPRGIAAAVRRAIHHRALVFGTRQSAPVGDEKEG